MDTCISLPPAAVVGTLETVTDLYSDAVDCVLDLPEAPDGIALMLSAAGVRGRRGSATDCPLATWIRRKVRPEDDIHVGVAGGKLLVACGPHQIEYWLPAHVYQFVMAFDKGRYPDLVGSQ